MEIQLRCYRRPGRATLTLEGSVEGDWPEGRESFLGNHPVDLSELDSRITGEALISRFDPNVNWFDLLVNSMVTVDGQNLGEGQKVRVLVGGPIRWLR